MRLLRRSACLFVVGALLTGGGAIALADPSDQPNQWEWYGDPPQNAELHFGSKSPTGGPLEASGGLASDDCGAVPAWGPGELALVRRQFTYSGPMSDGRSTIDLHGVMNGRTITGTVRFHVVGEWCVIDTPELSFTAKCVSENRCAQKRTRSARGNPGNGLIKPFVSIGGVKIGMPKAATRGVLGPPVGWPPRGSRASSSCIYRWRETEIQVFFGFLRRPCGGRSAVTNIDYVNGSQRRFTQKTP